MTGLKSKESFDFSFRRRNRQQLLAMSVIETVYETFRVGEVDESVFRGSIQISERARSRGANVEEGRLVRECQGIVSGDMKALRL